MKRNAIWSACLLALLTPVLLAGSPEKGAVPPEVEAKEWMNAPAAPSLAALKGKVVVVEFWATWCGPCVKSIPHLVKLYEGNKDKGLVVLGLTDEPKAKVKGFVEKMKMSYIVGTGSPTGGKYGVRGIPAAFVVGRDGTVKWSGHPMSGLDKAVEAALAEK